MVQLMKTPHCPCTRFISSSLTWTQAHSTCTCTINFCSVLLSLSNSISYRKKWLVISNQCTIPLIFIRQLLNNDHICSKFFINVYFTIGDPKYTGYNFQGSSSRHTIILLLIWYYETKTIAGMKFLCPHNGTSTC